MHGWGCGVDWWVEFLKPMRPCWVEITTGAFEDNYRFLKGLAGGAELQAALPVEGRAHDLAEELGHPARVRRAHVEPGPPEASSSKPQHNHAKLPNTSPPSLRCQAHRSPLTCQAAA